MDTLKKIGRKIKVILTQLIAFIFSFFKTEQKSPNLKKIEEKDKIELNTEEKKKTPVEINSPLPDEVDTKSDNHLTYKQSISTIEPEQKEEIIKKVQPKEIYFSEIVVEKTIVEIIEEKNDFKFSELSDNKKDKIKKEEEVIKEKVIPSLKKEMLNNKITTTEELKTNLTKRINNLYYSYNPIKNILNEKEEEKEEEKPEIIIEKKELNLKPEERVKDKIVTIAPREEKEQSEEKQDKKDFITIKKNKVSKEDKVYFIATIPKNEKKDLHFPEIVTTDTTKSTISEASKDVGLALEIRSQNIPFLMVPTNVEGKPPAEERIKNALIDTETLLNNLPHKEEEKPEIEEEDLVKEPTVKYIYKSDEDTISPEEKKIADIAVDREILEEIREDLKKQQMENQETIARPILAGPGTTKEEDTLLEKIEEEKQDIFDKIDELENTILEKKEETTKKEDKELEDEELNIILPIKKDEDAEEKESEEEIKEEVKSEELPKEEDMDIILPLPKQEIEEEQEETKEEVNVEDEEQEEEKDELKKIIITPLPIPTSEEKPEKEEINVKDAKEIKDIYRKTEAVIISTNNEIKKEEFEDKDYDKYTKQIDDLLYTIEMYKIKNGDTITPSEREKLNQEKNKLKTLKAKLETQKEIDIEKEKKELEAEITETEIQSIQNEIKQLHLEHQEEVDEELINKLTKMEAENDEKLAELEQQLIKSKLKKAARAAEIPSILALPFIRHKYFFYFTVGLFVNNHFNFLNAIFKRKNSKFEPLDLSEIKNGYDALDKAIDQTYENIVYLDYLENESISKYPNLQYDREFNKYIERLRTKLNNNYKKLQKKQKMINKYIKKTEKKNKVLKKYKLVKDDKAA